MIGKLTGDTCRSVDGIKRDRFFSFNKESRKLQCFLCFLFNSKGKTVRDFPILHDKVLQSRGLQISRKHFLDSFTKRLVYNQREKDNFEN